MISEIYGDYIDGSSIVYRKKGLFLEKGLSLDNGLNIFLSSKYFGDYYCGLAPVEFDHSFGYLKRDGTPAFDFLYKIGDDFKEDRAFVSDNNYLFLIDIFGNQIKQFKLSFTANQFSNGLARISLLNNNGNLKTDGFIDKDGRYVVPCIAEYMIEDPLDLIDDNDDYSDGLIRIKQNGKYGFIDENISVRIPFVYDWASKFVSGTAAVKKDNKFGFINTHNEIVVPLSFDSAKCFSEGLAPVCKSEKWGMINSFGQTCIDYKYSNLGKMINGKIPALFNNLWGMINAEGQTITPFKYDKIDYFHEGLCKVVYKKRNGIINSTGTALIGSLLYGNEYNLVN